MPEGAAPIRTGGLRGYQSRLWSMSSSGMGSGSVGSNWGVWDTDGTYSWEILDGEYRDIVYEVEFGRIATIERDSPQGVLVTLLDGRVLKLEGASDVETRGTRGPSFRWTTRLAPVSMDGPS